jgi:antitoxin component YwqK of YwqJK toxin-antitoxin module
MKKLLLLLLILNHLVACSQGKEHKTYYENGQVKEQHYLDETGKVSGKWKVYYENGKLARTGNIKNGENEGEVKQYYPSGEQYSVISY